jgi:LAO/AO transport system kinase
MKERLTVAEYVNGIRAGDRVVLSRAITLVESWLESDRVLADEVLTACLPHTGNAFRLGLTGVPGVGKSTFIDSFGSYLTSQNEKVAVLAVDPSSQLGKGSILGDKTRMERLSRDPLSFIRPSPSSGSLGGVTSRTREAMLLCDAAGFDWILVETVGVGQSETAVSEMVDFFMLLMLPGAGDELQGMKKGIMELADTLIINKADGSNMERAHQARAEYSAALHLFPMAESGWSPKVLLCSSLENRGMEEIAKLLRNFIAEMKANGWLQRKRSQQSGLWLDDALNLMLQSRVLASAQASDKLAAYRQQAEAGTIVPSVAARAVISIL